MYLIQSKKIILIYTLLFVAGLSFTSCKDNLVSSFDEEGMKANSHLTAMPGTTINANSTGAGIIIDSFDQGPQVVIGNGNGAIDVYSGSGPIGDMRELLGQEGHPVTSTHTISGTAPGENRISYSGSFGATIQELRYGNCIDPNQTLSHKAARFMHAQAECTNPNSSELNADFSGMGGIDIDFVNLLGGAAPNYWRVVVVLQTGTGGTFRYDNASVPYQQGPFTLSIPFSEFSSEPTIADLADVDGIAISMGNNGNFSTTKDIAISEIRAVAGSGTQTNVYISDSNVDTYDPLFPASADPNWPSSVCFQGNSFGINATWSNPHKAFQVTKDPSPFGAPHPWESNTFDAYWINSVNDMDSPDTKDINGNAGPGGHNWTRYDTQVAGNGEFVVQLLADNCSWVYLADENGNSPQLIGFQGAVSTPGEYGVTLDGNHTLTFIIFDGGGLAGGKFRLETTESFGGEAPDPIEPTEPANQAPVADAGSDQTLDATGPTTPVTLDGSGSSDADGDELTYSWTLNGDEVSTEASPTLNLADGTYTLTLTVSDGQDSDSDQVNVAVVNTIPVADAGENQTLEATGPTTAVTLDGSGSSDADGDVLTYVWSNGSTDVSTTVNLGVGVHTFTLTVADEQAATDSDQVVIEIEDTTAPVLSFNQLVGTLWAPNHKMVLVASGISASDIVDGGTSVEVIVTSNEPSNGRGDGNTDSDYEIVTNSDGTIDVYLRSERSGKGNGRIYTISMSTTDTAGNTASDSIEVHVPKSQGRGK